MASPYSEADRKLAAAAVVAHGTSKAASAACGIPASTIRHWRHNDEDFRGFCSELEAEFGAQIRVATAEILTSANSAILDRLKNGDVVFHPKTGEETRIPVKGKDAAVIGAIAFDKLRLIENQPTRIIGSTDVKVLADQLAALSEGARGQVIDVSPTPALRVKG